MKAALDANIEKVIYTSTTNTMGAHGHIPVNETAEFNHWHTKDHYCISKYLGKVEAIKFAQKGLPIVIVNPTLMIGVRDIKPSPSVLLIIDVATGYCFEIGAYFTKKPPAVTASEVRIGKLQEWYDSSKAIKELGLPQTPVKESIKTTFKLV